MTDHTHEACFNSDRLRRLQYHWVLQGSLYAFALVVLAPLLASGCAPYQLDLCRDLDRAMRPGGRLIGALPREHGKSTFGTVALILRELCLGDLFSSGAAAATPPARPKTGTTRRAAGPASRSGSRSRAGLGRRPRMEHSSDLPRPARKGGRPRAGAGAAKERRRASGPGPGRPAKSNILIVGANHSEAAAKLRLIVQQLEGNVLIRAWFTPQILPLRDLKGQNVAYGDTEIVLAGGGRVRAIGFGGKVRGQLFGGRRPDLIVLDDPEDDRGVSSPTQRRRLRDWCDTALLNSLDVQRGSLIWLGTLLRHDAVLAQWMDEKDQGSRDKAQGEEEESGVGGQESSSFEAVVPADLDPRLPTPDLIPRWHTLCKAALDENDRPLWPQRWSFGALMARRAEIGARAFAQEYLNQPLSLELRVFDDGDWRSFDDAELSLAGGEWSIAGEPLRIALGVDPALAGEASSGADFFACAVVGLASAPPRPRGEAAPDGAEDAEAASTELPRIYLLELLRAQLAFPAQLAEIERLQRKWHARRIGIEAVAYQRALSQSAISAGLPVLEMPETRAKAARIEAMARHAREGRIFLPAAGTWLAAFRREAAEYPAGAHDDQLDALARALECALSLGDGRREVEGADLVRAVVKWRGF